MEEKINSGNKQSKEKWIDGLKSEYNKIVWVDKKTLIKQTTTVVLVTVVLGCLISVFDSAILEGINLLMK